jgi:transcriptional regulator with XRE-family HTH domain
MSEVVEMQDPKLQKLVGTRLRALRKQRHWTQKELAAKVDVSFSVLNKYEGGWTSPSLDKLVELAKIFETSVDYLLTGQEPDNRPLQNRQLLERFRVLETLDVEDQDAVINLVDAVIARSQMTQVLKPRERRKA